jgi:hypothetical protein
MSTVKATAFAAVMMLVACGAREEAKAPPSVERTAEGFTLVEAPANLAEVRAIRERMFARVTTAGGGALSRFDYSGIGEPGWVEATLTGMDRNQYGVFCYDTNNLLAAAYRAAGYEAVTVNMGIENGFLTHAGALVKVGENWYYEDAYFNFEITEPFFEAIAAARQGAPLPVAQSANVERPVRVVSESSASFFETTPDCDEQPAGGAVRCRVDFTTRPFLASDTLWSTTFSELREMGLSGDLTGLFMLPIAVFDGEQYHTGDAHPLLVEYRRITGCSGGAQPSCAATELRN